MQSKSPFFKFSPQKIAYLQLVNHFNVLLNETISRCEKRCIVQYDQERNHSVSYHPEIETKKIIIARSVEVIRAEMNTIETVMKGKPLEKIQHLIQYVKGLCNLNFNNLFLVIFTGKLAAYWLPNAENILNTQQINMDHLNSKQDYICSI